MPGAAPSGKDDQGDGKGGGKGGDDKPGSGATSYPNCAAARKAGAAPLHKGDPGYSRDLDRDGDGVACDT
ncbi:excalibur calcium-binding domain-containing protein [Streptomyces sp. NPDC002574]|uniref:excalibur calcium-binding domain-containing protein n=1 Tax=Streptomyces sp. NPDC002574 TaxID=3364652 RepID=UPI00367DBF7F